MANRVEIDAEAIERYIGQLQSVKSTVLASKAGVAVQFPVGSMKGATVDAVAELMKTATASADGLIVLIDNTVAYFTKLKASVIESDKLQSQHVQS